MSAWVASGTTLTTDSVCCVAEFYHSSGNSKTLFTVNTDYALKIVQY